MKSDLWVGRQVHENRIRIAYVILVKRVPNHGKIGYGWVGQSKMTPNRTSHVDGPSPQVCDYYTIN